MKTLLIQDGAQFLDGYDGVRYEWTENPSGAWSFTPQDAQRRLASLKTSNPKAVIVERKDAMRDYRKQFKGMKRIALTSALIHASRKTL